MSVAIEPAIMDGRGEAQPLLQTAPRTGFIPAARAAIERLGSQITHGLQDFVTRGITPTCRDEKFSNS